MNKERLQELVKLIESSSEYSEQAGFWLAKLSQDRLCIANGIPLKVLPKRQKDDTQHTSRVIFAVAETRTDARIWLDIASHEANYLFHQKRTVDQFRLVLEGKDRPDGRDCFGFDANDLDFNGLDRKGFNYNGVNRVGPYRDRRITDMQSVFQFNRDGYDQQGFGRNGFNKEGFDQQGYDHDRYDKDGFDRDGLDKDNMPRQEHEEMLEQQKQ